MAGKLLAGLALGMSVALGAQAAYPEKTITVVVPFPAGGSTDAIARAIGASMVKRAPADGYTLLAASIGVYVMNPWLNKAGKLKVLAVTGEHRAAILPQVPTLAEAGVQGVDIYSWQVFAAPTGLPKDVKAKLHGAIVAALNEPDIKARLVEQGFDIVANTPEQFEQFQRTESARWRNVIETGKITAD